jgi:hypothetical protein
MESTEIAWLCRIILKLEMKIGMQEKGVLDELHEDIMSCIEHNLQQLAAGDDELYAAVNEDWHQEPGCIKRNT